MSSTVSVGNERKLEDRIHNFVKKFWAVIVQIVYLVSKNRATFTFITHNVHNFMAYSSFFDNRQI